MCGVQAGERYPHQHNMPVRSLEILGLAPRDTKPMEAIAHSMAQVKSIPVNKDLRCFIADPATPLRFRSTKSCLGSLSKTGLRL